MVVMKDTITKSAVAVIAALLVSACSGPTKTQTIRLTPPAELMAPCEVEDPRPANPDNAALIASRDAYREALAACNADKAALREWASEA